MNRGSNLQKNMEEVTTRGHTSLKETSTTDY